MGPCLSPNSRPSFSSGRRPELFFEILLAGSPPNLAVPPRIPNRPWSAPSSSVTAISQDGLQFGASVSQHPFFFLCLFFFLSLTSHEHDSRIHTHTREAQGYLHITYEPLAAMHLLCYRQATRPPGVQWQCRSTVTAGSGSRIPASKEREKTLTDRIDPSLFVFARLSCVQSGASSRDGT